MKSGTWVDDERSSLLDSSFYNYRVWDSLCKSSIWWLDGAPIVISRCVSPRSMSGAWSLCEWFINNLLEDLVTKRSEITQAVVFLVTVLDEFVSDTPGWGSQRLSQPDPFLIHDTERLFKVHYTTTRPWYETFGNRISSRTVWKGFSWVYHL